MFIKRAFSTKLRFLLPAFLVLSLAVVSIAFGTIGSSASANEGQAENATLFSRILTIKPFSLLASNSESIANLSASPNSVFVVNSDGDSDDVVPGDGVCQDSTGNCTLRAAVQEANATAGTDEITFSLPLPATIQLAAADISISEALTINGSGARAITVRGNSNTTNGIFNVGSTVTTTANINGLTIADSSGRGITNNGRLSLSDVAIKGNGTGIYNTARLNLNRVLINNNTSGGIYLTSTSTLVNISNTTVTGNSSSDFGGGIYSASADVTLNNVTISNNTAATSGGGFYYANTAAGINVRNTIIADNTATNGPDVFNTNIVTGTFTSRGNNLIGKNFVGSGFVNATNNDQVGTIAAPINPQLGSLQNNGGQTDTRALASGSLARNAGNTCVASANCPNSNPPAALSVDQRGTDFPRFYESAVDIGAFESFYPTPAISSLSPSSRGTGTEAFELIINGSNFVADSTVKFNGQSRATTFVSNTQLKAQILASDTTNAGQYPVTVTNPIPGGGESEAVNLTVASCSYAISPTNQTIAAAGGTTNVAVTTTAGCAWTAAVTPSDASWISISSGSSGSGSGTVVINVAANTGPARTGTVTIAGKTFTVNQDGGCTFNINPTSQNFTAAGGNNTVAVTASNAGCQWTATVAAANNSWINITAGSSGTGNGTVSYTVASSNGLQRTGTITIAGKTFTVNQQDGCTFNLNPTSQTFTSQGGSSTVALTASNAGCAWTATVAASASWITITNGASGTGNGTVSYTVAANTGPARSGTITIGGQTFTVNQQDGCTFTIAPTSQSVPASGGTVTVTVTASNPGCQWTASVATANNSWISITSGASGTGNGTVTFTVAANTGVARTGTLTIAGQTFTVNQASGCAFTISPTEQFFTAQGGSSTVAVTANNSGCAWTAVSNAPWITITSGASGTGNGTVSYTVVANAGLQRDGTITIGGQTFTVHQENGCSFTLSPTEQNFTAAGGSNTVAVTASNSQCQWMAAVASANNTWITITAGASGTGNGTVSYTVAANTGPARSATLIIGNKTFTVTQDSGCTYSISPESQNFTAAGGSNTVAVTTSNAQCQWSAAVAANTPWITINGATSGTGNGSIQYTVAASTVASRSGTINIAGKTFTVTQADGCVFSINPTSQPFTAAGGTVSVAVTTTTGCTWTAAVTQSDASWISITSGASGTGSGTVVINVAANTGPARTGTVTIAGKTFTVTQDSGCTFNISPANQNFTAAGGSNTVAVTASNSGCQWTAVSNATWITITSGASGTGNGTVTYTVAANTGPQRTGTLTIGGKTFTVTQDSGCTFTINPTTQPFTAAGGTNTVAVTASNPGCQWTAVSNATWITITAGASGTGNGTVSYSVAANNGAERTGTITIAGQTFTINQLSLQVTNLNDSGAGSLRQAVVSANNTPGNDVIIIQPSLVGTITLTGGEITVLGTGGALEIRGPGADKLKISGNNASRIFFSDKATFTVSGLTLTKGNAVGARSAENSKYGGAILVDQGTLKLIGVHVTENTITVPAEQGSRSLGGGVYIYDGTNHLIENSTFSSNSSMFAGGLYSQGELVIKNSTFSGNVTEGDGAGILSQGISSLRNVTITNNKITGTTPGGAGLSIASGALTFTNTIIAGNIGMEIGFLSGEVSSGGHNLVGDTPGDASNTQNSLAYQPTDILNTPPLFGTLAMYGGPTPTEVLLPNSPAINSGDNANATTTDQRGAARIVGGTIDIGAYEFAITMTPAATALPNARVGTTYSVETRASRADGSNPTESFTYSIAGGSLPTGLTLDSGIIFGNPQSGGPHTFVVRATGADGMSGANKYTLNVICAYQVSPASRTIAAGVTTGTVNVTTATGCPWTAVSNAPWITVTNGASGSGNGSFQYSAAANPGPERANTITVGNAASPADSASFSLTQTTGCSFTINMPSQTFLGAGGTGTVAVTASNPQCGWSASTTAPWITITSSLPIIGSGNLNFSVAANTGNPRFDSINIAGNQFTVNQNSGCPYSLSSTSATLPASGGTGNFTVTTNGGCPWTATTTDSWITITSGGGNTNSGSGPVAFSVSANAGGVRTGKILAAGQEFTITQNSSCSFSVSPSPVNIPANGGTATLTVTTGAGCSWSATTSNSWLAITGGSGSGGGTFTLTASANTGSARSGTVTVNGQSVTVNQAGATSRRTAFDFDADGKADIVIFRPSDRIWYMSNSQAGFSGIQFGANGDKLVPADYDGDGKTDVAVYRPSTGFWYIQGSTAGFYGQAFGEANDIPAPADYDGDGKADIGVYRPSIGTWLIQRSQLGFYGIQFGINGDKPMPSDYDGDGKADIAVFRPSDRIWYINRTQLGFYGIQFGSVGDQTVPADYDGDGKTDVAVYRPSTGFWYIQGSTAGFYGTAFGISTDLPAPGDYDGDGKADQAVFRSGTWFLNRSTQGFAGVPFGVSEDKPAPNMYVITIN